MSKENPIEVEVLYERDVDGNKTKFKHPQKGKSNDEMPRGCLFGCWFVVIVTVIVVLAITIKIVRWSFN